VVADLETGEAGLYTITLRPVGSTVACGPEETVLAAILRVGASVMFGCRGGGCGTCKMRLTSGQIEHGRCSAAVLLDEEKTRGWFLSCQARALSDLTIELSAANKYRVLRSWQRLSLLDS
jgi:CDP-4-dehydro-6-deoxyglucose reductase, E3